MLCSLAVLYHKQGYLHKAWDRYQQALDIAVDDQRRRLPIAGRALTGLAQVVLEWNELEKAEALLGEGMGLEQRQSIPENSSRRLALARVYQAKGEMSLAQEQLNRARLLAQQFDLTEIDDLTVEMYQTRLWIAQDNLSPCESWVKQRGLLAIEPAAELETDDFVNSHLRKYEYPMLARLRLAQGQPGAALALLDPLLPKIQAMGRMNLVIETQALRALAFDALGQTEAAISTLEQALRLAEPEGYVRTFSGEGEAMRTLLGKVRPDDPRLRAYVRKLLAACGEPGESRPPSPALLPAELSNRELEVLRLLVHTSLTIEEIAAELYVTAHTVRSHTKNIYSKLDVHSRLEAIERAAELGIL
jgi:LuxR family maltose regulon positive regulatory protein